MSNQSGEAWLARRVADWPHSTFHKLVKAEVYPPEWAGGMADALGYDDWHAAQCAALIAPYACCAPKPTYACCGELVGWVERSETHRHRRNPN